MSKNSVIIAIIVVFVALVGFIAMQDDGSEVKSSSAVAQKEVAKKPVLTEEEEQVKRLKEEAGVRTVDSSNLYKTRCASCHGYSGEGVERLGVRISGQSESELLKKLDDFKANRVPNTLMTGLLINTTDVELKALAKEISTF